jgi:hypothetical protein
LKNTTLQTPKKPVGGWLIALILWFGFYTPDGLPENTANISKMFDPYADQLPILHTISSICILLLWSTAIVSIYCGYVLAFRKTAAVTVAKRGLIFIFILQLGFSVILLALLRSNLQQINFFLLVRQLMWLVIWYSYLVRSKRVKETYGDS